MFWYLVKRLLFLIPTLLVVSILAFGLTKLAPGDPVITMNLDFLANSGFRSLKEEDDVYQTTAVRLGLDKPTFYFSILPAAYPDTLYRIHNRLKRDNLVQLIRRSGSWENVQLYFLALREMEKEVNNIPDSLRNKDWSEIAGHIKQLYFISAEKVVLTRVDAIMKLMTPDKPLALVLKVPAENLKASSDQMLLQKKLFNFYIPKFYWHGLNNQYHHWISGLLSGHFGVSYKDGRRVEEKIGEALKRTLLLNGIAVLVAFLLAIPLGVWAATNRGKWLDRAITTFLFFLFSLPTFWIGTLLLVYFTTPEYGMDFFPTLGLVDPEINRNGNSWQKTMDIAHHMVLPIFCLTYGSLAYIYRQMRNSMLEVMDQPFIQTAIAKGLSSETIIWKHAFKNALFPIITLIASIFPFLLAGSFIVEYIFQINGMGLVTINAIYSKDWPTVYAVLMLSALFTIAGIFIADVLYRQVDPRVKFNQ